MRELNRFVHICACNPNHTSQIHKDAGWGWGKHGQLQSTSSEQGERGGIFYSMPQDGNYPMATCFPASRFRLHLSTTTLNGSG